MPGGGSLGRYDKASMTSENFVLCVCVCMCAAEILVQQKRILSVKKFVQKLTLMKFFVCFGLQYSVRYF